MEANSGAFAFFLGAWFLDRSQGIPYFKHVFVMRPDLGLIESIFRSVIMRDPRIARVEYMRLDHDKKLRKLSCDYRAMTKQGEIVDIGPLIIEVPE